MTLAGTRELVTAATQQGTAVAAINVITLEHAEAIARGATEAGKAVILAISENTVRFHGGRLAPITAATIEVARLADVPISVHLDHVTDDSLVEQAAAAGFSSLMYDAAALSYSANCAATRRAREVGHAAGLWVEAELGYVGGKPDAPQSAHATGVRTDPEEAAEFVQQTGVDGLAVAVGSSHAMTSRTAVLDLDLIERLRDRLAVPLVLHGSSGVPDQVLRDAVAAGITKVNIGTAVNIAMTTAVRAALARDTATVDPRTYLSAARDEIATTVRSLVTVVSAEVN